MRRRFSPPLHSKPNLAWRQQCGRTFRYLMYAYFGRQLSPRHADSYLTYATPLLREYRNGSSKQNSTYLGRYRHSRQYLSPATTYQQGVINKVSFRC